MRARLLVTTLLAFITGKGVGVGIGVAVGAAVGVEIVDRAVSRLQARRDNIKSDTRVNLLRQAITVTNFILAFILLETGFF
jgi:hypothetical protein